MNIAYSNSDTSLSTHNSYKTLNDLISILENQTNDTINKTIQKDTSKLIFFLSTCIENSSDISSFRFDKNFSILSTFAGIYTDKNFQDYVQNHLLKNGVYCVRYASNSYYKITETNDEIKTDVFFQPVSWIYKNDNIRFSLISAMQTDGIWKSFFSQEIKLDSSINKEDLKQKLIPISLDGHNGRIPFIESNIKFFEKIILTSFERTVGSAKSRLESI